jgi:hypothetical protein
MTSLAARDALLVDCEVSLIPRVYVDRGIAEGRLVTALDGWAAVET